MYIKSHTMIVSRRQNTTLTLSPTVTGLTFSISDTRPLYPLHSGKLTITSVSLINMSVPSLTGFTSHHPLTNSFTSLAIQTLSPSYSVMMWNVYCHCDPETASLSFQTCISILNFLLCILLNLRIFHFLLTFTCKILLLLLRQWKYNDGWA